MAELPRTRFCPKFRSQPYLRTHGTITPARVNMGYFSRPNMVNMSVFVRV